ncbi:MAG: hypothetical protein K0S68_36 [Candidatus Saccharibacteria bacterium]|jgi:hypothetical protein|nr:hypothetical protein [Candidatus Saccharibacteria bacterium]
MPATDRPLIARELPQRRTFWEALGAWLQDTNKGQLFVLSRALLLVLAGYAPIAALNDALIPFTFGLTLIDNLEIPIGVIAAIKIFSDVRKYQNPDYRPRHK